MNTLETIFQNISTQLRGFESINFTNNMDSGYATDYRPKGTLSIENGEILITVKTYFDPSIFEQYNTRELKLQKSIIESLSFHINRYVVFRSSSSNTDGWTTWNLVVDQTTTINPLIDDVNKFTISAKKWKNNDFNSFYSLVVNFFLNLKKYPDMFEPIGIKLIDNVVTYDGTFVLKLNILNHYDLDNHQDVYDYHMFIGKTISGNLNAKIHTWVTNYIAAIYERLNKNVRLKFVHITDKDRSLTIENRYWCLESSGHINKTKFQPDWKNQNPIESQECDNHTHNIKHTLNIGDTVTLPDGSKTRITDIKPTGISLENIGWCGMFTNTYRFVIKQTKSHNDINIDKFLAIKSLLDNFYVKNYLLNGHYDPQDHKQYSTINFVETFKRLRLECINLVVPKEYLEKFLDVDFNPKDLNEIMTFLGAALTPLHLDPLVQSTIHDCFYSIRKERREK